MASKSGPKSAPGSGFGFVFWVSDRQDSRETSGSYDILVIVEGAAVRIWPEWTVVEVGTVLAFAAAIESCR